MENLTVIDVQPIGSDSESAAVTLKSKWGEVTTFSHPCQVKVGDVVPNHLTALDGAARAAFLQDWPEHEQQKRSIERLEQVGPFAYQGCGRVLDRAQGLITVLGFVIELDDISCAGPVEFECTRIDL